MASRDIRRAKGKQGETVSESMEKRHHLHPVTYVLVVIVTVFSVIAFILLPMGSRGVTGKNHIVFGTWDGHEIAWYQGGYFDQQRLAYARQVQESGTESVDERQLYGIWYQAFKSTALRVAAVTQAKRAGVEISKDALDEDLLTWPAYLDEKGRFSEAAYNATPLSDRVATREQRKEELLTSRYFTDLSTGIHTGSREQAFVAAMAATERKFSFVTWKFASFPDEEVRKYGEATTAKFRKAKLARITVASEREAKQIRTRLADSTASFAELAKVHSDDSYAASGGDMGWQYAYALEPDLENKAQVEEVLALKAGEVADPMKGPFGWAIYRCDAEAVGPDLADAAVLGDVRGYLTRYEKGKIEDWFVERAGKFARRAAEATFAGAAREAGVEVSQTGYFPINLSNTFPLTPLKAVPENATPYSAAYSEDFFYRAFSLSKDQASSQPIVLDDQVIVLKVAGEQPISADNAKLMDRILAYLANQSLQSDVDTELMNERRLKSTFDDTFFKLYPSLKGS
jgi:parvulin-like peptidyl-prolyl isomerase